jgi:N-acetylglucosamine-6-phosphate deacetylase
VKNRTLYLMDYCLTPHRKYPHAGILCENGRIIAVGAASAFEKESGLEVIDLPDTYATPGIVDTHIHGAGGFDSTSAGSGTSEITLMSRTLSSHGITSFLPTIVSASPGRMFSAVSALSKIIQEEHLSGAAPVGINIEGPFLNKEKHGSQYEKEIRGIDIGEARELIGAGQGQIKIMTFAPELENSVKLVELLLENNIIPSMGHSLADEQSVLRAVDAGARRCTHLYNGMPPLHHRSAGLTAIALTDDRIHIELILDGSHIHPVMVDLACRSKPKDKVIGISDAIQGTGLHDGLYHVGDSEIQIAKGRVTTMDGTLAGSTMTLERGWRHLIAFTHLENTEASACLTYNPAKSIGLDDRGEIRPGKIADITFFDLKTNSVRLTVCQGSIVYDSQGFYSKLEQK